MARHALEEIRTDIGKGLKFFAIVGVFSASGPGPGVLK
jgi:hypothetical protein